jgi:very-short-patch-repair endonuclease
MLPFNRSLKNRAREPRKQMTEAERYLWFRIRRKQVKNYQFYRQKNIANFIVDFYCPAGKLIIEVDGGQHYSEGAIEGDKRRDAFLQSLGFRVLRFSDGEVLRDTDAVLGGIYRALPQNPPLGNGESKDGLCRR